MMRVVEGLLVVMVPKVPKVVLILVQVRVLARVPEQKEVLVQVLVLVLVLALDLSQVPNSLESRQDLEPPAPQGPEYTLYWAHASTVLD